MDTGGTLRTNDSTGALIGELETGLPNAFDTITLDPATGKLAVASVSDGVGVIDPMTDLVQRVPGRDRVASLGFGQRRNPPVGRHPRRPRAPVGRGSR